MRTVLRISRPWAQKKANQCSGGRFLVFHVEVVVGLILDRPDLKSQMSSSIPHSFVAMPHACMSNAVEGNYRVLLVLTVILAQR